jgi:hypothetical protein
MNNIGDEEFRVGFGRLESQTGVVVGESVVCCPWADDRNEVRGERNRAGAMFDLVRKRRVLSKMVETSVALALVPDGFCEVVWNDWDVKNCERVKEVVVGGRRRERRRNTGCRSESGRDTSDDRHS